MTRHKAPKKTFGKTPPRRLMALRKRARKSAMRFIAPEHVYAAGLNPFAASNPVSGREFRELFREHRGRNP